MAGLENAQPTARIERIHIIWKGVRIMIMGKVNKEAQIFPRRIKNLFPILSDIVPAYILKIVPVTPISVYATVMWVSVALTLVSA